MIPALPILRSRRGTVLKKWDGLLRGALLLGLLLLGPGCAYRLGPTNGMEAGDKTIRIGVIQDETKEARLSQPVVIALRRILQQDGTFKLSNRDDCDILVTGTILEYDRSAVSFQPRDILTARDFQITMTARLKAVETSTGKVLLDRTVLGKTTLRVGSDMASAERQALPLLAEDLARNATSYLVDGTW